MRKFYAFVIFIFLLSGLAFSEYVGNITINFTNTTTSQPVTGFFGYTVQYCNTTADCMGYVCFNDFDGSSAGNSTGWCDVPTLTGCYYNSTIYAHGYKICNTGSSYKTCSLGAWSSSTSCGINQTCSSGNCSSSTTNTTTGTSGTGSTSNLTYSSTYHAISITTRISDFEIVQGNSTSKTLTVKNTGNHTLYNITLTFTGLTSSWYSILPEKYNNLTKNSYATFSITFVIPIDADVKSYTVTSEAGAHNTSAKDTKTFTIKVQPSTATVQNVILPRYDEYLSIIPALEKNITDIEKRGKDTSGLKNILNDIKAKLEQVNQSISNRDYYSAKVLLDEASNMIDNFYKSADIIVNEPGKLDVVFIVIIIIIVVAAAGFVAFMFLPSRKGKEFHIKPQEEKNKENKILDILRRKKKQRDKFVFEFKK